jgi:hypothetical protein
MFGALAALERDPTLSGREGELLRELTVTAERLHIPLTTWQRWLVVLVRIGALQRSRRGQYRLLLAPVSRRRVAHLAVVAPPPKPIADMVHGLGERLGIDADRTAPPAPSPEAGADTTTRATRSSSQGAEEGSPDAVRAARRRPELQVRPPQAVKSLKEAKAEGSGSSKDLPKRQRAPVQLLIEVLVARRRDLATALRQSFPLRRALGRLLALGDELGHAYLRVSGDVGSCWIGSAKHPGGVVCAIGALVADYEQQLVDQRRRVAQQRMIDDAGADDEPAAAADPAPDRAQHREAAGAALAAALTEPQRRRLVKLVVPRYAPWPLRAAWRELMTELMDRCGVQAPAEQVVAYACSLLDQETAVA